MASALNVDKEINAKFKRGEPEISYVTTRLQPLSFQNDGPNTVWGFLGPPAHTPRPHRVSKVHPPRTLDMFFRILDFLGGI